MYIVYAFPRPSLDHMLIVVVCNNRLFFFRFGIFKFQFLMLYVVFFIINVNLEIRNN